MTTPNPDFTQHERRGDFFKELTDTARELDPMALVGQIGPDVIAECALGGAAMFAPNYMLMPTSECFGVLVVLDPMDTYTVCRGWTNGDGEPTIVAVETGHYFDTVRDAVKRAAVFTDTSANNFGGTGGPHGIGWHEAHDDLLQWEFDRQMADILNGEG